MFPAFGSGMGYGCPQAEGRHRAGPLLAAAIDEDVLRYQFVKKKGYVRLHTNRGDLNLELHCDMVGVAAIRSAQGGSGVLYLKLHLGCACSRKFCLLEGEVPHFPPQKGPCQLCAALPQPGSGRPSTHPAHKGSGSPHHSARGSL